MFESIYDNHPLKNYSLDLSRTILSSMEETRVLNARIYNQVFDNIFEWFNSKNTKKDLEVLRCLILVNINFILYHTVLVRSNIPGYSNEQYFTIIGYEDKLLNYQQDIRSVISSPTKVTLEKYLNGLSSRIYSSNMKENQIKDFINFLELNNKKNESIYFSNKINIAKDIDNETLAKINNFIETGILINE